MLSIEVNGIPLDLPNDFSATLNLKSPLFNSMGDYSFPFKLPATPRNVDLLNWTHRVESNRDPWNYIAGKLLFNGEALFEGTIRIKKAGRDSYEGSLFIEKGNFNWEIKDKLLTDVDFGSIVFENDQQVLDYLNSTLDRLYPLEPIACPEIFNEFYFDPPTEDPGQMFYNYMSRETGMLSLYTALNNRTLLVPSLYLKVVLDKMAQAHGYTIEDEFFNCSESLRQLAFYSSYSINFRFWFITTIYFNLLLPKVKISKLITDLEKMFNCSFLVNTKSHVIRIVSRKVVLNCPDYIEFSSNITAFAVEPETPKEGMVFTMETDEGDKVFEEKLESQKTTLEQIRGSVERFENLPLMPIGELGEIRYVIEEDRWYQYNVVNWMMGWRVIDLSHLLQTRFIYKKNIEANKVEIGLSSLVEKTFSVYCGNLSDDFRKTKPRLFFIRRIQLFGEKFTHTWAMNYSSDTSLFWGGANGLFAKYWKEWVDWEFYGRKKVAFSKQMNHIEIKDFDLTRKVMIGGTRYLVSELQVVLQLDSIKTANLKGYSCP